ncbi:MAG: phosphatase PAP2 family protein [bacterium]|nr:phosphatase PAP2 family protein [bacterium]
MFTNKRVGLGLSLAVLLTAGLAVWHPGVFWWEAGFYRWLFDATKPLGLVWVLVSAMYPVAGLVILIMLWNFWKESKKDEVLLMILIASGAVVSGALKRIIGRPCPNQDVLSHYPTFSDWVNKLAGVDWLRTKQAADFCWPSGHVTAFVVFFGGVILLMSLHILPKEKHKNWLKWVSWFLVAAIGLSRIFLGQHWLLDVVGGYLVGALWLWLVFSWFLERKRS